MEASNSSTSFEAGAFSVGEALDFLRPFASQPRVPGTVHHIRAREMLLENLVQLAPRLEVSVQQEWIAVPALPGEVWVGQVHNVVGRLQAEGHGPEPGVDAKPQRGLAPRSELLLAAHYDTVPGSPGAADDGAGIAVLLQALRHLAAGPPPLSPVTVLFSDLEEYGLLGAEAYARAAGLTKTAVVINLDARGNRGSPLLYQTSGADLGVLRRVQEACPGCQGYSFGNALAPWLPNATDFAVLGEPEISGLNFAWVGGGEVYHGAGDAVDDLDAETLGRLGSSVLALASDLAHAPKLPPPTSSPGQSVFFTVPVVGFQVIPMKAMRALLVISLLLLVMVTVRQWEHRRALLRSLVALVQMIALGGSLSSLVLWIGSRLGTAYPSGSLVAVVVAASCCAALAAWFGAKAESRQEVVPFSLAGLWLWAALTVAVSLVAPSASYLFVLPLFPASLFWGCWLLFLARVSPEKPPYSPLGSTALGRIGLVLLALLLGLLWAPLVVPAASLMSPSRLPLLGLLLALPFAGLLGAPFMSLGQSSRRLVGVVATVTAACLVAVFFSSSLSSTTDSFQGGAREPQEPETPWVRTIFSGQTAAEATCLPVSTPWRQWPEVAQSSETIPCPEPLRGEPLKQVESSPLSSKVLYRPGRDQKGVSRSAVDVTLSYDQTPAFVSIHLPHRQSLQGWAVEPVGNLSVQGEDARGGATVRIVAPPEGETKMRLLISSEPSLRATSGYLEIAAAYPAPSGDWQLWVLEEEF